MSRQLTPRNQGGTQTRNAGHANANSKHSLETMHVRKNDARDFFRRENLSQLGSTRCNDQGRIDGGRGGGQLGDELVDEG